MGHATSIVFNRVVDLRQIESKVNNLSAITSAMPLAELQTLEGHSDRVWHVAWSPNGGTLASCSGDKTVRIWTRAPGAGQWRCSAILEDTHSRTIRSCCWSPSGRHLATASFDKTTAIWQVQGGIWENIAMLEGHESEVKGVAWSPSGSVIATCSRDKTVWFWEALPGNEYEVLDVKHGHSQDVKRVAWHPSGEILVSASYDDTIKLWVDNDDEWICAQTLSGSGIGHDSTVWDMAFDAEGRRMVSCSDDATLKVWECSKEAGEPRWRLLSTLSGYHDRTVFSVDWSRDGLIATGCADNGVRVFSETDAREAQGVRELFLRQPSFSLVCRREDAHSTDVNCVQWHPSEPGLLASAGDDCTIKLWRYSPTQP